MKESEFIRYIENNPVVSTALCENMEYLLKQLPMLYMFTAIVFLKNDYVQDDIHYDIVKNNLIIIKPTLKQYYRRTRQVDYNGCTFYQVLKNIKTIVFC